MPLLKRSHHVLQQILTPFHRPMTTAQSSSTIKKHCCSVTRRDSDDARSTTATISVDSLSPHTSFRPLDPLNRLRDVLHKTSDKNRFHKPTLPHTITERSGGNNLWVTAPTLSDDLEKQGMRWCRQWKTRFVQLNGRTLSYFKLSRDGRHRQDAVAQESVQLTATARLEDVNELEFAITPSVNEKRWVFRAKDQETKLKWCKALHDSIDIRRWLQHYKVGEILGVGGHGVVKTLVDQRDGKEYAMKCIDASKFKNRAAVVSEVEILSNITNHIRHPNLVQIYKVYEEEEKIFIILDRAHGGELYDAIVRKGCYSERDAAGIVRQLMSALQALHHHNILHLDLKPENILLSSKDPQDATIVLTDFGLARMVNGKENPLDGGKTNMAGTIGYIAPEVIAAHQYTAAADVFSAGVILFILLVGYPPFYGDSEVEILLKISRGDFQFHAEDWSHISLQAKELVARMLDVRAQDRITVDEVLNHPWIQEKTMSLTTDKSTDDATASSSTTTSPLQPLPNTQHRMEQFNFERKTDNMAVCMASMLTDDTAEAEYRALIDEQSIHTLLRQLTPSGSGSLTLDRALIFARRMGLSPYVDVKEFVKFLDRDNDGRINAHDFCGGVQAMRVGDESFSRIIYAAMLRVTGADTLTRDNLQFAFEILDCPQELCQAFFQYVDERPLTSQSIQEVEFTHLFTQFPCIGLLFMMTAKKNVMELKHASTKESDGSAHSAKECISVMQLLAD